MFVTVRQVEIEFERLQNEGLSKDEIEKALIKQAKELSINIDWYYEFFIHAWDEYKSIKERDTKIISKIEDILLTLELGL